MNGSVLAEAISRTLADVVADLEADIDADDAYWPALAERRGAQIVSPGAPRPDCPGRSATSGRQSPSLAPSGWVPIPSGHPGG